MDFNIKEKIQEQLVLLLDAQSGMELEFAERKIAMLLDVVDSRCFERHYDVSPGGMNPYAYAVPCDSNGPLPEGECIKRP
jgi:hypothetical protein